MVPTPGQPTLLPAPDEQALLRLARLALEAHLEGQSPPRVPGPTPALSQKLGAFVSLHLREELAGCIGYIVSEDALPETVVRAAIAAATGDPRFPPLRPEELPEVRIEISILSPLQPVDELESIRIGPDGLLVEMGPRRGLLLPQVAVSEGWSRQEFLGAVCIKAGLPPDAWRQGARLRRFTAQVFSG